MFLTRLTIKSVLVQLPREVGDLEDESSKSSPILEIMMKFSVFLAYKL